MSKNSSIFFPTDMENVLHRKGFGGTRKWPCIIDSGGAHVSVLVYSWSVTSHPNKLDTNVSTQAFWETVPKKATDKRFHPSRSSIKVVKSHESDKLHKRKIVCYILLVKGVCSQIFNFPPLNNANLPDIFTKLFCYAKA